MIDIIKKQFTNITIKCLERYGAENGTTKEKMQLVFKLGADQRSETDKQKGRKEERDVEYLICKEYNIVKEITFLQVLGVKIDMSGKSLFVPNFIKGALFRLAEKHKIPTNNVRVILSSDGKNDVVLWLYDDNKYIVQFSLDNLFETEDILEQQ
jgi:hypothetical protein